MAELPPIPRKVYTTAVQRPFPANGGLLGAEYQGVSGVINKVGNTFNRSGLRPFIIGMVTVGTLMAFGARGAPSPEEYDESTYHNRRWINETRKLRTGSYAEH